MQMWTCQCVGSVYMRWGPTLLVFGFLTTENTQSVCLSVCLSVYFFFACICFSLPVDVLRLRIHPPSRLRTQTKPCIAHYIKVRQFLRTFLLDKTITRKQSVHCMSSFAC